eukprot:748202-Pelagomonas_calceolata.AAC.1
MEKEMHMYVLAQKSYCVPIGNKVLLWRHPAAPGVRALAPLLSSHRCCRLAKGEVQHAIQGGTLCMIFMEW